MSDSDVEGVDYAFPPIPSVAALKAAGKVFVCRYGGPGSASKQLTASERDALHAAGIAIVANAEGTADGLKGGWDVGVAWAKSADAYFARLGLPKDRPIYLSVDFDAGPSHWSAIDAAMDGAASVLGRDRVGVYGGYKVIAHLAGNGKARWLWQTYAWSGGNWHPKAHIQQYRNGVTIGGADCDLNRAMSSDYGQWTGEDMTLSDAQAKTLRNIDDYLQPRVEALAMGYDTIRFGPHEGKPMWAVQTLKRIEQKLDELPDMPPADAVVLKQMLHEVVRAELDATRFAGPTPPPAG